jgi:hypothetical protein
MESIKGGKLIYHNESSADFELKVWNLPNGNLKACQSVLGGQNPKYYIFYPDGKCSTIVPSDGKTLYCENTDLIIPQKVKQIIFNIMMEMEIEM